MRYGVLLVGRHLGEGAVEAVGNEQRIVTEPLHPALAVDDPPFDNPFEEVFLAACEQRDNGTEPRATIRRPLQIVQQQAVVGLKIVTVGGIAGRMDARRSVQRLDLEARIVGKTVESRTGTQIMRFLGSVAFERCLLLGNLLRDAAHAGRH